MPWQDYVLTAGAWIFIIALIPAIRGKEKPPASTSIITGSILAVYALVYATMGLWISVVSTSALSISWFALAVQKMMR